MEGGAAGAGGGGGGGVAAAASGELRDPRQCRFSTSFLSSLIANGGFRAPCMWILKPSEAIRKVVFGGQVSEEEAESLNKR